MARVISWRYEGSIYRYIIRFDNRRRIMVKTTDAILKMEEQVQREILSIGVQIDNCCAESDKLIRRLKYKFDPITVTKWAFNQENRVVTVTWSNQVEQDYSLATILNTGDIQFLEQLCKLRVTNTKRDLELISLEGMMQGRLNNLKKMQMSSDEDNFTEDETDSEEEGGSDGYISDEVPDDEI